VWIAVGGTPQSVVRAGTLGLPMALAIIGGYPERFAPMVDLYREAASRAGHDPATLQVSINSHGFLADDATSPVKRHTPEGAGIDAVIDLRAVFQSYHRDVAVDGLHPLLTPQKGSLGLRDYEKVFCPDFKSGTDIFDARGIDRDRGCMVVVRPDQHVAHILPLDGTAALERFFAGFMLAPK